MEAQILRIYCHISEDSCGPAHWTAYGVHVVCDCGFWCHQDNHWCTIIALKDRHICWILFESYQTAIRFVALLLPFVVAECKRHTLFVVLPGCFNVWVCQARTDLGPYLRNNLMLAGGNICDCWRTMLYDTLWDLMITGLIYTSLPLHLRKTVRGLTCNQLHLYILDARFESHVRCGIRVQACDILLCWGKFSGFSQTCDRPAIFHQIHRWRMPNKSILGLHPVHKWETSVLACKPQRYSIYLLFCMWYHPL